MKLKNYVGKCTEGDQCGYKSCLKSPCTLWNTCSITGFKSTTGRFKNMLNTAVKIVNFIKTKHLPTRMFQKLCEETGGAYTFLLHHTDNIGYPEKMC